MNAPVVALVLVSAFLHAAWNTLLRGGRDRLWSMSVMNLTVGGLGFAGLFAFGLPDSASWPYAVASGLIHVAYNILLLMTYRSGDLGQTYPIARGASPAMVALGAYVFAGESPDVWGAAGIALVCGGILTLSADKRRIERAQLAAALGTAATIAAHTIVDGTGVRLSGDWLPTRRQCSASIWPSRSGSSPRAARTRSLPGPSRS